MMAGKTVTVTWDIKGSRFPALRLAFNGIWVNKVMVLAGYAWWFERYAPDDGQLRGAQEAAREAKRGLWADRDAVAPWDWRKGVRKL